MDTNVFRALDADWEQTQAAPSAEATLTEWRARHPALMPFAELSHLVAGLQRRHGQATSDELFRILVGEAAAGDRLAARTVLQALMPGLRSISFALAWIGDREEVAAAVLAAAWERICCYPLARRPRRVAANIVLDVRQQVSRTNRRRPLQPLPDHLELAGPPAGPPAAAQLLEVVAEGVRVGRLSSEAASVIVLSRVADVPVVDLARQLGCRRDTLLRRRHRAEVDLAGAVAEGVVQAMPWSAA